MKTLNDYNRDAATELTEVQKGNQQWWTENTMSYDWKDNLGAERFSEAWFAESDRRFIHAARLFATDKQPFDRMMPLDQLRGKRVVEIGCGMGLHSEILTRAGANLTSIDISPTSVEATTRRLALKGLPADVRQADAETLPFETDSIDFVWSWGVIHHSSRTGRVVREIARVLKPGGECRIMVYNRAGMSARLALIRNHILMGGFLRRSYEETLYQWSDGFTARFYVSEQAEDLFRTFFRDVSSTICGQDVDAIPLPRQLRRFALKCVPESWVRKKQSKRGSFIFLKASNPE